MKGQFTFECTLMPWTEIELNIPTGFSFDVDVVLTEDEFQALVDMMRWAWENEWFEKSSSEMVCSELLQKFLPELYQSLRDKAHSLFIQKHPDCQGVSGVGDYEIFPPDEVVDVAGG